MSWVDVTGPTYWSGNGYSWDGSKWVWDGSTSPAYLTAKAAIADVASAFEQLSMTLTSVNNVSTYVAAQPLHFGVGPTGYGGDFSPGVYADVSGNPAGTSYPGLTAAWSGGCPAGTTIGACFVLIGDYQRANYNINQVLLETDGPPPTVWQDFQGCHEET